MRPPGGRWFRRASFYANWRCVGHVCRRLFALGRFLLLLQPKLPTHPCLCHLRGRSPPRRRTLDLRLYRSLGSELAGSNLFEHVSIAHTSIASAVHVANGVDATESTGGMPVHGQTAGSMPTNIRQRDAPGIPSLPQSRSGPCTFAWSSGPSRRPARRFRKETIRKKTK